jgi:hypothetical protein
MTDDELNGGRGSDGPFRDAGLSDPDIKLIKADLAAGIIRFLESATSAALGLPRLPASPRPTSPAFATPT